MRAVFLGICLAILSPLPSCKGRALDCASTLSVKLDNLSGLNERSAKMAQMREFLWEHWRQKRCGTLLFTSVSKEGKVSHSEFRVVPTALSMTLKVKIVRDRVGHDGKVIPRADPNGEYEAYTIERIVTENPHRDWKSVATLLRDDETESSSKYWLRFKDREGYPITYF
jgi:hypothetical protein